MTDDINHDFRNGIGNLAGILLRLNIEQQKIVATQQQIFTLFREFREQMLRVLSALERAQREEEL